jgi:hypothetical protein
VEAVIRLVLTTCDMKLSVVACEVLLFCTHFCDSMYYQESAWKCISVSRAEYYATNFIVTLFHRLFETALFHNFLWCIIVLNFGSDWELGPYLPTAVFMKSSANLFSSTWQRLLAFWPGLIFRNVSSRLFSYLPHYVQCTSTTISIK